MLLVHCASRAATLSAMVVDWAPLVLWPRWWFPMPGEARRLCSCRRLIWVMEQRPGQQVQQYSLAHDGHAVPCSHTRETAGQTLALDLACRHALSGARWTSCWSLRHASAAATAPAWRCGWSAAHACQLCASLALECFISRCTARRWPRYLRQ